MRLTALATMKIEGDLIEEFVRHTLSFVDNLIVVDNGSLDAGRQIIGELESEGAAVILWEGDAIPSRGDGWSAQARRAFADFDPDYLLMLDIDEFIRVPSRSALEEMLGALGGAHAIVPWVTYVPTPEDDPNETRVLARIQHRFACESRAFSKIFVHRSFTEQVGASIVQGNHAVVNADGSHASSAPSGVELAHIPIRSLQQIQSKAILGWPTFLAMGFTPEQEAGYQWRRLNDRLLSGAQWTEADFFRLAWHYLDEAEGDAQERPELVYDPLPPVERRYPTEIPDLLVLAVAFTRQLAVASVARTQALVESQRAELNAIVEAERAQSQALVASQREESLALLESYRIESQVAIEQERVALLGERDHERLLHTNARASFEAEVRELRALLDDMRSSNSWRFTLPIRLAAMFVRKKLSRARG